MIAVTATQAARNFANILDQVEHGETIVITRDGVPVGRLSPERRTSAERLKAALRDNPAGTLSAIERGTLDVDPVLGADDAAIASITAMELLVGVERADEAHKQARSVRVEATLPASRSRTTPSR
jgi:prevent-host-death family protein